MPKFVWDPDKAAWNLREHKVSFEAATRVFDDPFYLDEIDDREDYGEERSNIIGMVDGPASRRHVHPEEQGPPASSPPDWRSHVKVAGTMKRNAKAKAIDWTKADRMTDEDIHKAALADPDAQPLTDAQLARMRRPTPVKRLRIELGLSQTEFAERFHIPVGTIRDWEQRRSEPDAGGPSHLKFIAADPAFGASRPPTSHAATPPARPRHGGPTVRASAARPAAVRGLPAMDGWAVACRPAAGCEGPMWRVSRDIH